MNSPRAIAASGLLVPALGAACAVPPPAVPDPVPRSVAQLLYWAPQDLGEAPDQGFGDYQQCGLSTRQYTALRALVADAAALGPDRPAEFLARRAEELCAALGPEPTRGGYP